MIELPENTALIVVDVQQGFDDPQWGARNNPEAEENIAQLLKAWRETHRPVFHVRHLSLRAGSLFEECAPGSRIKEVVKPLPSEPVVHNHVESAFIRTDLHEQLLADAIGRLVIVGFTTDQCASTTARMAGNLGFDVLVASDGTAAFEKTGPSGRHYAAREVHDIHLASLESEVASIVTTEHLLNAVHQPA